MYRALDPDEIDGLRRKFGDFPILDVSLDVNSPFLDGPNQRILKESRRAEICYLLHRGRVGEGLLFHRKRFYPREAYRLPTGGIHGSDSVLDTLVREVREETSFVVGGDKPGVGADGTERVVLDRLLGVLVYRLYHRSLGKTFSFATYHFVLAARPEAEPICLDPEEELAEWRWVGEAELRQSAARLERVTRKTPWADWGRFRALSHRSAGEWLLSNLPESYDPAV